MRYIASRLVVRATAAAAAAGLVGPLAHVAAIEGTDVSPYACVVEDVYTITSSQAYRKVAPGTTFKDGPGGTMTVTVQTASTLSTSVSASFSVSTSMLVAEANAELGTSLVTSKSVTVGHTYSREITSGKYGNVNYGSDGRKLWFSKYRMNANCTSTLIGSGTATAPSNSVGWKYWETSS
jgi:hypothetical protein